ncbi:protein CURVATURE THYLAKOID 1C, chloroplastic isoform X1 [Malania oleifera]|uniref:protein CURVATURE THYLAKOID 1C, chloroplastic isoform X1 n=1 Tax=Malania oleifera TaxID=397392 RepID=UPI0025ADC63F|nr:protein CURVATURE THYLAKOID 1C, chloroplastic isoform X1 [Malania oleifera]
MTSLIARLPPALLFHGRQTLFGTPQKYPISFPAGKLSHSFVAVKATGESSESSTSLIVKSVQNVWDKSEDRFALFGFGFAAVVAIWASANLITAIDKLPLIPNALELVGILFSSVSLFCDTLLICSIGQDMVGKEIKILESHNHLSP